MRFGLGAWWPGFLAAERFAAPAGTTVVRLPLGSLEAIPSEVLLTFTLVARDGAWRALQVRRGDLPSGFAVLAFAALGDGSGLGLLISAGAWRGPGRVRAWRAWRRLQGGAVIGVDCGAAVPGHAAVRIPPGPVEAMHLVAAPGGADAAGDAAGALLTVERFWREGGGCYLQGWFHAFGAEVREAAFLQDGGEPVVVTEFSARPDLVAHYPMLPAGGAGAGFAVHLPRQASASLRLRVTVSDGGVREAAATLGGQEEDGTFGWGDAAAMLSRAAAGWERFRGEVVDRRLEVLEIGARVVAMGSTDQRAAFAGAGRYAGMDIHPAPGLDVVGDVHGLSALVGEGSYDAMFSSAVLEHLAMPWVAAAEMNRALRPNGIVFHRTHQCWPVHERPNDFFRFSDMALCSLFGPAHGFEVIESGMALPMAAYARDKSDPLINQTALNPAFGMSWVLARKVAEVAAQGADAGYLEGVSRQYPPPG